MNVPRFIHVTLCAVGYVAAVAAALLAYDVHAWVTLAASLVGIMAFVYNLCAETHIGE